MDSPLEFVVLRFIRGIVRTNRRFQTIICLIIVIKVELLERDAKINVITANNSVRLNLNAQRQASSPFTFVRKNRGGDRND